ncbi:GTP 3',8-cyclase MoaA [Chlorobaculum sp. 24CR]|uniref:GTP 3',8-cyclase MoaA n=1 Tax=Chlorobaculum sp. 24CR TaxID=2508878 RepID=UPI00100B7518|nr:GTP 3',8-cyclase MoaA [Chlorobaculum sp. 24CR]RXK85090.1 GTP 3',8-cyclase MoaA [Chlorobaculum sp. 24CR]
MTRDAGQSRAELTDRFGRTIDYVRIAVTSACNLRCTYCLKDEAPEAIRQLATANAAQLIALFGGMGVRKIRFTGGEPLLHPRIAELVRIAKTTPGIDTIRLTTNGVLLDRQLEALVEAGLDGVNLSLDTLDRDKFLSITRRDRFEQVRKALDRLLATPGLTVKINTLMLRGINSDEIPAFVELTRNHDVTVRFMELQPFDDSQIWRTGRFMGAEMIRERLVVAYPELEAVTGHSTEHYSFRLPGHRSSIAIIPAFSRNFCSSCSKLRITADAKLIGCLYHHESIDLAPALKGEMNEEEIKQRIVEAVQQKPKDGLKSSHDTAASSMSRIGG